MRTSKRLVGLVAVGAASLLVLSACGKGGNSGSTTENNTSTSFADCATKPLTCNGGNTKQGGTITYTIEKTITGWNLNDTDSNKQKVIGRFKYSGAPLTGHAEHDTPDFAARAGGGPVIPAEAHVRLAAPENNGGIRILRRGYSFTDGIVPAQGQLDAGLFFIAYQKDPRRQFVPLQRSLGARDALNEYVQHVGSALFACPPGVPAPGLHWAQRLLD